MDIKIHYELKDGNKEENKLYKSTNKDISEYYYILKKVYYSELLQENMIKDFVDNQNKNIK